MIFYIYSKTLKERKKRKMKCALELKKFEDEYKKAEEQKRIIENYEQTLKNELDKQKTIDYAENVISPKLEEYAKGERFREFERIDILSSQWFEDYGVFKKDILGQTHFILLKFNGYPYANNDRSYELKNESINLDYLEKYLEQFCLKLKIEKNY